MSSELVLRTIPSHHLGVFCRPTKEPYRRVVGMDIGQKTLWVPQRARPAKVYEYNPSEARREVLDMPGSLALRATVFFQHWLAPTGRSRPYNCHSFADFMEGPGQTMAGQFSTRSHLWAARKIVAGWSEAEYPLPMGERGVIAGIRPAKARHSLIGLGVDSPDCLQVTQLRGFMALDTYDSVLEHYGGGRENKDGAQLYIRQPSGSQQS